MSDLDPHPQPQPPVLEDPSITRVMPRHVSSGRTSHLFDRVETVATSLSVIVPVGGAAGEPAVASMGDWRPERIRIELLIMEDASDPGRTVMREQLARSGRSWRMVERPPGGRAAALSAAAEAAEHEFVLIGSGGHPPYQLVGGALSLMWAEGGDVALIERGATDPDRPAGPDERPSPPDSDPSATLAQWLGLSGAMQPDRIVVMRRWVARWLFNEVTRAISPGEEVADRTRLLGIGIIHLTGPAAD